MIVGASSFASFQFLRRASLLRADACRAAHADASVAASVDYKRADKWVGLARGSRSNRNRRGGGLGLGARGGARRQDAKSGGHLWAFPDQLSHGGSLGMDASVDVDVGYASGDDHASDLDHVAR